MFTPIIPVFSHFLWLIAATGSVQILIQRNGMRERVNPSPSAVSQLELLQLLLRAKQLLQI